MRLLTGNDLLTGAVAWWTGEGWSPAIADAVDVGDRGEALARVEEAARRVVGAVVIDASATPEGPRPAHIKDRIRATGPTVRPDLALAPTDPAAGSWVI